MDKSGSEKTFVDVIFSIATALGSIFSVCSLDVDCAGSLVAKSGVLGFKVSVRFKFNARTQIN